MKRYVCLTIVAAMLPVSTVHAAYSRTAGGWDVAQVDDGCGMALEYEGPGSSSLAYFKETDNKHYVIVTNSNWSARKGQTYAVDFDLNGTNYGGGDAIGIASGGRSGFVVGVESDFERDFMAGSTLVVYLDAKEIDRLSLDGTTVAVQSLNQCMRQFKAEQAAAAREKARWESLPVDPFTDPADPQPANDPGAWVRQSDYPLGAMNEKRGGTVGFSIEVGTNGRAQSCDITDSSGHTDLDDLTCNLIVQRARFKPRIDDRGEPVTGHYENKVNWEVR